MQGLTVNDTSLHREPAFVDPVENYTPSLQDVAVFDQNGYDMCPVELEFAMKSKYITSKHRATRIALRQEWMTHFPVTSGAHFNHCNLFERKGFDGYALEQLIDWTSYMPLVWKLIKIRPKWGLDFSIDYVDATTGDVFEVLHWEWDSFDYDEMRSKRDKYEPLLLSIDWDDAAKQLLKRKDEWYTLDFFAQSEWKCKYFGIEPEQFKMVLWE